MFTNLTPSQTLSLFKKATKKIEQAKFYLFLKKNVTKWLKVAKNLSVYDTKCR